MSHVFTVERRDLRHARWQRHESRPLGQGAVRMYVDSSALTANKLHLRGIRRGDALLGFFPTGDALPPDVPTVPGRRSSLLPSRAAAPRRMVRGRPGAPDRRSLAGLHGGGVGGRPPWLNVVRRSDPAAIGESYHDLVAGRLSAQDGLVLSP